MSITASFVQMYIPFIDSLNYHIVSYYIILYHIISYVITVVVIIGTNVNKCYPLASPIHFAEGIVGQL